ncbi:DNA/RNA nuclease SfsA [Clostridium septicum]|uniref:Sugar fermentation stimulation protein homolog n=1 Tax=Clostridium septicum TaxID=1504 RepID=A0A9N7JL52_CLOSE|nr:DNA/RNA nuclease SfsA [Clostridium septicum]AYE34074.1 DNA/RNA nuclease SfsA [Clostridium septicum]MDU1313535.1 DNA/RNA nuclease SfsA [Clostridium septicum]QAS59444.1 DNA/RNA nuclease SfsA [Clostridium septicum]UEC21302.1 DNA/RNA nuclease SfsA [Clostridium septicum]USS00654.1 DNA/RNA nuclease SfsA [Clostridium septicum]
MKYNKNIYEAIFVKRPNRFNAEVILNGEHITVHVPNTGRCRELLIEGATVFLREELNPNRKTKYDLVAVIKGNNLISIDSQIPNKVVFEALSEGKIEKLKKYCNILKEKTFGKSRFDFKLSTEDQEEEYFLEVKGVTLEEDGYARFPDAPTERGARHILELIEAKREGYKAGILFLIQLENVNKFSPNDMTDPDFGEALRLADKNGVDIFAYNCKVHKDGIIINNIVEIVL